MSQTVSHPVRAAVWMIGAIVSFTSIAVAGRELASELDTFEIMLFRSIIGIGIVLSVARLAGTLGEINTRSFHIHLVRNISHFAGQNLWFYAIALIPLAQVFALEFTSPIWAMFLAVVILGERLTRLRVFTAFMGFAGILIITRPWAVDLTPGVISAALAAIGFAGSAVFTRALTRSQSVTCILFWLVTMQSVFALVLAGYDGDIRVPDLFLWPWIVLISIGGLVAHFCLTKALSLAPAAVVVPVDFARLPLVALVGMALYGEPLQAIVLIGAAIIFSANYLNILSETRKNR
jgi:drug/metabolite transporter (DMT)-like permease